jgi:hypothetical protein
VYAITTLILKVGNSSRVSVRESTGIADPLRRRQPEILAIAQEIPYSPAGSCSECLILDVGLPDLNGLDLQKRVVESGLTVDHLHQVPARVDQQAVRSLQ